jgi:hypothetical protein
MREASPVLRAFCFCSLFVDGVQHPQGWLTNFDQPERDLLRVTAAVLDLDRLSRRRPHDTKAEKRELHWRRVFDIEIAVENPSRWQAVCGDLRALGSRTSRPAKEVDNDLFAATR